MFSFLSFLLSTFAFLVSTYLLIKTFPDSRLCKFLNFQEEKLQAYFKKGNDDDEQL